MPGQEKMVTKKRGRPPTGMGILVGVRLHAPMLTALDRWRVQHDRPVSRPEAIRRLLEVVLANVR